MMNDISTVDGFAEMTESVADMIKYTANEPSVGLYYIQQHVHKAAPNIVNLNNDILNKSRETHLHTEDLEDSCTMVRLMKQCGSTITDSMIRDITQSLAILATKQLSRGSTRNSSFSSQFGGGTVTPRDGESTGYFSSVFKSAREKAVNLKWPRPDSTEQKQVGEDNLLPLSVSSAYSSFSRETDELPVSSEVADQLDEETEVSPGKLFFLKEDFDEFKADRAAKLEAWLEASEDDRNDVAGEKL